MPYYPAAAIKQSLCLLQLFARDGHVIKQSGKNHYCLCPFHAEKSPSCHISKDKQFFHCFGCNVGGDIIAYWQRSRQCDFKTALVDLASIANITSSTDYRPASLPPVSPTTHTSALPPALSSQELRHWAAATQRLLQSEEDIHRIAHWRGLDPELIRWAALQRLIGMMDYGNAKRVAFAVKAYTAPGSPLKTVSTHIRLAPHSPMNNSAKQSWRYHPTGKGSWPFIIGDPATATQLFITEGQWDALALCQIMQWGHPNPFPDYIAILGTRGASASTKLITSHFPLHKNQVAFLFLDSDTAGDQWLAEHQFAHQLQNLISQVYVFSPNTRGSDLNQRLKDGLTRQHLLDDIPIIPPATHHTLRSLILSSAPPHPDVSQTSPL